MSLKKRERIRLREYLEGDGPSDNGEWGMHCPFHEDKTRSASLNVDSRLWYCQVCETGGSVDQLVSALPEDGRPPMDDIPVVRRKAKKSEGEQKSSGEELSEGSVAGWHSALLSSGQTLDEFCDRRGLNLETIREYQIGWDNSAKAYTIPIRDGEGKLVNIRRYQLNPSEDRRKIWSVAGHGAPALYPIGILKDNTDIIVCEGELDALITIQNGFPAITRTAGATSWKQHWNPLFDGKNVYVCHDADTAGMEGNRKVATALSPAAAAVSVVTLPYEVTDKHGKDLTDYWLSGATPQDFKDLLGWSNFAENAPDPDADAEMVDVGVLDSFDAGQYGKPLKMRVTITGKKTPTYLVPEKVEYSCTQDAGTKCAICPMNEYNGHAERRISPKNPVVLEMMDASKKQLHDVLREHIGAVKCPKLIIDPVEQRSVEELFVRPSVDVSASSFGNQADYTNRKIISVGRHDSQPNNTVEIIGTLAPNPKTQHNELQAWEVRKTETNIERYKVTERGVELMKKFQTSPGQRPLKKVVEIVGDLSSHVTKIYGRPEMHALYDLVYHSALQFRFGGSTLQRGWLEALVVGDTRTGKSEVAERLRSHYSAGEMVSCESATFAGVVGGLQQLSGSQWEVTWGAIPLNDRRLVILDEISGLTQEQIAQMSSIRSSGEAQLTKIRSERTYARTRLVWLGNPRNGRMSEYTYGVQAILPLIGNNEDVARFDLAMSVSAGEVKPEEINRAHFESSKQKYDSESCQELLQWAWSRQVDNILWAEGAEEEVFKAALDLGGRYTEEPPLIQAANVRVKVARIAVALAARTFSTDETYENVIVTAAHVRDAVKFIDILYGMSGFGYKDVSEEKIADEAEARKHYEDARQYLSGHPGLAKFLRAMGSFRRGDMEDMMNLSKEEANATINTLWKYRMIRRQGPQIKIQPLLHQLLREVRN